MAVKDSSQRSSGQNMSLSPEDYNAELQHIEHYFGPVSFVLSEEKWEHVKVDIAVIEPSAERKYYTLVTIGFSAVEQKDEDTTERVELVMMLHDNWIIPSASEEYYWPVRLLKNMARHYHTSHQRISAGYCYCNDTTFCEKTSMRAALVYYLNRLVAPGAQSLQLPGDRDVYYYSVTPLHGEEMEMCMENGAEFLIDQMIYTDPLVDNNRTSAFANAAEYYAMIMDDVRWHASTIEYKEFSIPRENAASHMAIFLRYMIENGMMSQSFMQAGEEIVKDIVEGRNSIDVRGFLIEQLNSVLDRRFFNDKGMTFVQHYYMQEASPYYAADVDSYAHNYLSPEEYFSREYDTEGYLFVPYNRQYYENMKKVIDARRGVLASLQSYADDEAAQLSEVMKMWLSCKCYSFPALSHDMPLMSRYAYSLRQAPQSEYVPVMIEVSDSLFTRMINNMKQASPGPADERTETLLAATPYNPYYEKFIERFGVDHKWYFDQRDLIRWRWHIANTPRILYSRYFYERIEALDSSAVLDFSLSAVYRDALAHTSERLAAEAVRIRVDVMDKLQQESNTRGRMKLSPANLSTTADMLTSRQRKLKEVYERASPARVAPGEVESFGFFTHRANSDDYTKPMLIAELPVTGPQFALCYIGYFFEGKVIAQDDLPGVLVHWYKTYCAMPAVITADGIEFVLGRPLDSDSGPALACELIALCPQTYIKGNFSQDVVKAVARMIRKSNSFYLPLTHD